jgi:HSP20 family molecular chaperone IbpA
MSLSPVPKPVLRFPGSRVPKKQRAQLRLKAEPGLENKDLQVTLTEKSLELSGPVRPLTIRNKAVRIAKLYAGDREVENN